MFRRALESLITLKLSLFSCTGPIINPATKRDQWSMEVLSEAKVPRGIFHPIRMTNVVSNTCVLQCMRPIYMSNTSLLQVRSGALRNSTNSSLGHRVGLVDVGFGVLMFPA